MLHNQDSLDSYNIYNKFMAMQTYRDRLTWKIVAYDPVTNTEKYLWPQEYQDKVSSWLVSGKPLDASLSPYRTGQQPNTSVSGSTPSWLGSLDKMSRLKAAANELILMANNRNKDLTDAWQYWRRMAADPSAFWTKDASIPTVQQTPESYRLLSPTQQASIRSAREASAWAWLKAVEDERLSRERTAWTSLGNLVDMYQETNRREESDRGYNLDKWYKEQTLARANQADWLWSYYTDNSWNLKPVDKTKVFTIGWVTYDFWPSWPSGIYATNPKWWTLITDMLNSVPQYESYRDSNMSSMYWTSFDKDIERLAWTQSPLFWMGQHIWDASSKAWVSPELVYAILRHETANWKSNVLKSDNNPWGITWSSNWPASMKGSKRQEWGHYVKFPTLEAWIDRTIKKIADSITDWSNYTTSWKNTYTDKDLRALSKKSEIDLADLKWLSDQELIAIEQSLNVPPLEKIADSEAWNRIMAAYWINDKKLLIAIMNLVNQDMPYELKAEQLQQYGIKPDIIEAINKALWKEY